MKNFMGFTGASSAQTGDYLASYAAGLTPSPDPGDELRKRQRSRTREPEDVPEEKAEEPPDMPTPDAQHKPDALGLRNFPAPGTYPANPRPGSGIYGTWDDQLQSLEAGGQYHRSLSKKLETDIFYEFRRLRDNRIKHSIPSSFDLFTNLQGNRNEADLDSLSSPRQDRLERVHKRPGAVVEKEEEFWD